MPCQTTTLKLGNPDSASVGRSCSDSTRVVDVTPYALTLADLMYGVVCVVWSHRMSTWPPSRSFMAGAVPLYGMVSRSVWIALMNMRPHRCDAAPTPALAKEIFSLFALRYAMRSLRLLGGR